MFVNKYEVGKTYTYENGNPKDTITYKITRMDEHAIWVVIVECRSDAYACIGSVGSFSFGGFMYIYSRPTLETRFNNELECLLDGEG